MANWQPTTVPYVFQCLSHLGQQQRSKRQVSDPRLPQRQRSSGLTWSCVRSASGQATGFQPWLRTAISYGTIQEMKPQPPLNPTVQQVSPITKLGLQHTCGARCLDLMLYPGVRSFTYARSSSCRTAGKAKLSTAAAERDNGSRVWWCVWHCGACVAAAAAAVILGDNCVGERATTPRKGCGSQQKGGGLLSHVIGIGPTTQPEILLLVPYVPPLPKHTSAGRQDLCRPLPAH